MDATFVPLLTVKEVAEILKVRPETVRDEINAGRLKASRVGAKGGIARIRPEWLDDYLERRKILSEN
jgi:excisionase family DNA binding protein